MITVLNIYILLNLFKVLFNLRFCCVSASPYKSIKKFFKVRDLGTMLTSAVRSELQKWTSWSDRLGIAVISKRSNCPVYMRSTLQRFIPRPVIFKFLIKDIDDGLGRSRTTILRTVGWKSGLMGRQGKCEVLHVGCKTPS